MSDAINLEGKEYTASRKAAQLTGYAQDYIGQLARGGAIDAQRVGGLWYVSMDSLESYKRNADTFKPVQPERVAPQFDTDSVVSFDGKDYVSASRASKLTGYNPDYVGQLARAGKILSRQIGNRWYVEREGLLAHKREKDGLLAHVQVQAVGLSRLSDAPTAAASKNSTETELSKPYFTYVREGGDLFASPIKESAGVSADVSQHGPVQINIRNVDAGARVSHIRKGQAMRSSVPRSTSRKTMHTAVKGVAALTVVIMLSYGIVMLKDSSVYARAGVVESAVVSGNALAAAAATAFDTLGDLIERVVAPEAVYERE